MGRNAAVAAASALRLLSSPDLRQHPAPTREPRRSTATNPPAPLNLGRLDYLDAHVNEVVTHVRSLPGGETIPPPARDGDIYDWYIEHTGDAAENEQAHRDLVTERHALEHAIELGNFAVVRPHPCPACGGWGLFWDQAGDRVRCSDRDCRTPDGLASSFTLGRLAAQKVHKTERWRRQENWRRSAT